METVNNKSGFWDKLFGYEIEYSRFAVISISLVLIGCLGGIAVGLGAGESVAQLILITLPTMAALSAGLAVMPVKWILNLTIVAVVMDILIMLYNATA